jgi:hypothetical protein
MWSGAACRRCLWARLASPTSRSLAAVSQKFRASASIPSEPNRDTASKSCSASIRSCPIGRWESAHCATLLSLHLNCSHEGFRRLFGCLAIRVSWCDDVPYRPRGSPAVESGRPNNNCHLWGSSRTTSFGPSNHQLLERACSGIPTEQKTPHGHPVRRCRYLHVPELSAVADFREIAALASRHYLAICLPAENRHPCHLRDNS